MKDLRFTIAEVSKIYGISRASIYRAIERGDMTYTGGKVSLSEIDQLRSLGRLGRDGRRKIE